MHMVQSTFIADRRVTQVVLQMIFDGFIIILAKKVIFYGYNMRNLTTPIDLRIFAFDDGRTQFRGFVKIKRKVTLAFIVLRHKYYAVSKTEID